MRGLLAFLLLAAASLGVVGVTGVAPGIAQDLTEVADLIETPEAYSNDIVIVEGELVGDYGFRRTDYMWTQLNQDSYAASPVAAGGPLTGPNLGIGIRMDSALAQELGEPGGYRLRGPIVRVTGIWKYHDPDRQGESYLDVLGLVEVEGDLALSEGISWISLTAGLVLIAAAGALTWSYRRARDAM